MTVDIVILNWNGRGFLEKYLPSVLRSIEGMNGVRVVVADNRSTDDSLRLLSEKFPEVQTIVFNKNHGFAKGYNKALTKLDADLFVLLNSDVEVPEDWLYPLVEWMELHPECGICGPKIHQIDQREMFEYAGAAGGYIDRLGYPFCRGRIMKMVEKDEGQYDIPTNVFWVTGAALVIRSSLFFSLGGFCEEFEAHMEEIDLCWRARLEGWKVSIVPRSTIYHVGGGSLANDSPRKLYLNFRNNLLMLARNLPRTCAINACFNLLARMDEEMECQDSFTHCTELYDEYGDSSLLDATANMGNILSRHIIRRRMILDGVAAISYLLKFRFDYFKAVLNAHRDYKRMKAKYGKKLHLTYSEKSLISYVEPIISGEKMDIAREMLCENHDGENNMESFFSLRGMWSKLIVWQSIFKKGSIFADIKDKLI